MTQQTNGIATAGRNEEQPLDKQRARDPSSPAQDAEQGHSGKGQSETPDRSAPERAAK